jgi:hypothetical protein
MNFFCRLPWVHLFFSERTIFRVRSLYRPGARMTWRANDRATEDELNQMSVAKTERIVGSRSDVVVRYRGANGIRGQHWTTKVPLLRELCTMQLTYVLEKR